jgi:hypothetical protein
MSLRFDGKRLAYASIGHDLAAVRPFSVPCLSLAIRTRQ